MTKIPRFITFRYSRSKRKEKQWAYSDPPAVILPVFLIGRQWVTHAKATTNGSKHIMATEGIVLSMWWLKHQFGIAWFPKKWNLHYPGMTV